MHTEDEAKERQCRVGGTVEDRSEGRWMWPMCDGSQCMHWRWQPLQADQPFLDAVKARMDQAKETHPKAVKYVRANLAALGLPDKPTVGLCGLAGMQIK